MHLIKPLHVIKLHANVCSPVAANIDQEGGLLVVEHLDGWKRYSNMSAEHMEARVQI